MLVSLIVTDTLSAPLSNVSVKVSVPSDNDASSDVSTNKDAVPSAPTTKLPVKEAVFISALLTPVMV